MASLALPPPSQPLVDEEGKITAPWYRYFTLVFNPISAPGATFKTVNFDTAGIDTTATVSVGTIPAGALHIDTFVRIRTAFNATVTNTITVGTASDPDHYMEATEIDATTVSLYGTALNVGEVYTSDTPVYVKYTQSGTAATTGVADVVLLYVTGT